VRRRPSSRPSTYLALVAAFLLVAAACGKSNDHPLETGAAPASPTTKGADSTTTSAPAPPTWPLTGMLLADLNEANHPAVVIKMDNEASARPQSGINQADVVYELLVEGITRYALVFHSTPADPVGPVRSARSSDIELTANLGRPLFGFSGANPGVLGEVANAQRDGFLVDVGGDRVASSDYYRDKSRVAPHNFYTRISALLEHYTPPDAKAPPALFRYRLPGAPSIANPSTGEQGVTIHFGAGMNADYVWDAERGGWDRFQVDEKHNRANSATVDPDGVQVAPANVVIMFLPYGQSPSDARSPMAISTGEGDAIVLTDGKVIHGHWRRPNALLGWELIDGSGNPILLTPGRTWVGLPEVGSEVTPIDAGTAAELLAIRR
jgi:hypothetical protein